MDDPVERALADLAEADASRRASPHLEGRPRCLRSPARAGLFSAVRGRHVGPPTRGGHDGRRCERHRHDLFRGRRNRPSFTRRPERPVPSLA